MESKLVHCDTLPSSISGLSHHDDPSVEKEMKTVDIPTSLAAQLLSLASNKSVDDPHMADNGAQIYNSGFHLAHKLSSASLCPTASSPIEHVDGHVQSCRNITDDDKEKGSPSSRHTEGSEVSVKNTIGESSPICSSVPGVPMSTNQQAACRVLAAESRQHSHSRLQAGVKGEPTAAAAEANNTESVIKLVQVLKYTQTDWNRLHHDLVKDFQAQMSAKKLEWSGKMSARDTHIATLEQSNKKLYDVNEEMRAVMNEFEQTITQMHQEKERASCVFQGSVESLEKERDQALEDVLSVEAAFSDLHRRYEKTKGVLDGFKLNEEMLKRCVEELQDQVRRVDEKVVDVRQQAEQKLDIATEELEIIRKTSAADIARLDAALRKAELQVRSMEDSLELKVRENKELTAICDELIAKVQ